MGDPATYDQHVDAIHAVNAPILAQFQTWLEQSGAAKKTIKNHMDNIAFFAEYLVYYDNPLKRLDEADSSDVSLFLSSWFPRKAVWANETNMKAY